MENFSFHCRVQLDLPVLDVLLLGPRESQEVLDVQGELRDIEIGVGADWCHAGLLYIYSDMVSFYGTRGSRVQYSHSESFFLGHEM